MIHSWLSDQWGNGTGGEFAPSSPKFHTFLQEARWKANWVWTLCLTEFLLGMDLFIWTLYCRRALTLIDVIVSKGKETRLNVFPLNQGHFFTFSSMTISASAGVCGVSQPVFASCSNMRLLLIPAIRNKCCTALAMSPFTFSLSWQEPMIFWSHVYHLPYSWAHQIGQVTNWLLFRLLAIQLFQGWEYSAETFVCVTASGCTPLFLHFFVVEVSCIVCFHYVKKIKPL